MILTVARTDCFVGLFESRETSDDAGSLVSDSRRINLVEEIIVSLIAILVGCSHIERLPIFEQQFVHDVRLTLLTLSIGSNCRVLALGIVQLAQGKSFLDQLGKTLVILFGLMCLNPLQGLANGINLILYHNNRLL